MPEVIHSTCNMGACDSPDMYALSPRACGPRALGIHIRQIPRAHVTTITYAWNAMCCLSDRVHKSLHAYNDTLEGLAINIAIVHFVDAHD